MKLADLESLVRSQLRVFDRITTFGMKGRLRALNDLLHDGETVEYIAVALRRQSEGLLAVTDRRLLYRGGLGGKVLQSEVLDLPYSMIASVNLHGGFRWMGQRQKLTLVTTGDSITFSPVVCREVDSLVAVVMKRAGAG